MGIIYWWFPHGGGGSTSTDPGVANVKLGTGYTINGVSLTGTLIVPSPASGVAGQVDLNNILDQIKYVFTVSNTTTASPIDLSSNLSTRVQYIGTLHPEKIPLQASFYPFVTCYVTSKDIETKTIAVNQLRGKRKAVVNIDIVGAVFNTTITDSTKDNSDRDCNYLMENLEYCLRAYETLNSATTWQFGTQVNYYDSVSEQGYLRAGIFSLKGSIYY